MDIVDGTCRLEEVSKIVVLPARRRACREAPYPRRRTPRGSEAVQFTITPGWLRTAPAHSSAATNPSAARTARGVHAPKPGGARVGLGLGRGPQDPVLGRAVGAGGGLLCAIWTESLREGMQKQGAYWEERSRLDEGSGVTPG